MKSLFIIGAVAILILGLSSCQAPAVPTVIQATVVHTQTAFPTSTAVPTYTRLPPSATPTPLPTFTPFPTYTQTPTQTPNNIATIGGTIAYQLRFDTVKWNRKSGAKGEPDTLEHKSIPKCSISHLYSIPAGGKPNFTNEHRAIGGNMFNILIISGAVPGEGMFVAAYSLLNKDGKEVDFVAIRVGGSGKPDACLKDAEEVLKNSADLLSNYR